MKKFLAFLKELKPHKSVDFSETNIAKQIRYSTSQTASNRSRLKVISFWEKFAPSMLVACTFMVAKTVWAYQTPSSVTYANNTSAAMVLPSGLSASIAVAGSNLVLNTGTNRLDGLGSPQSTYYSPQISANSFAARYDANLGGCANATTTVQTCSDRGTITLTFNQPVKNPRLHISGIGESRIADSININSILTLASAQNGSTAVTPSWSLGTNNGNLSVSGGNSVTTSTLTNNTVCNAASNPAGCGTLIVNGTVTQLTLTVGIKYAKSAGSLPVVNTDVDSVTFTVSGDEDFGDTPASYDPTQAASHILSDLTLGTSVDADNTTTLNSTTSPNAVTAGVNNNGTSGDGADEDAISNFPVLTTGSTSYALTVPIRGASKAGQVCGWVDFNRNGTFAAGERTCTSFASGDTSVALNWLGLSGLQAGNTYVRLRASYDTAGVQSPNGRLNSGEVEDYRIPLISSTPVNLTVTKITTTPNAVAGGAASYRITATNTSGSGTATNVQLSDVLPSGFTYDATIGSPTLSGGATSSTSQNPTQGSTNPSWGTFDIPAGGSVAINFSVNIDETNANGTYQNPATVTHDTGSASYNPNTSNAEDVTLSTFTPPVVSQNSTPPTSLGGVCGLPGKDGPGDSVTGVVNTYYPAAVSSASAGSTSIIIGAATGATTSIVKGDLLVIIQMQDASINPLNSASYGSGNASNLGSGQASMGNSGLYEYVVAMSNVPLSGGTLTFKGSNSGGLANTYTNTAATASSGQRTFQIVRIPQYSSLKLQNTLTAQGWNGQTGGIIAVDVAGDMNFNNRTIDTVNRGFRAGYSQKSTSGNSTTTYVALATTNAGGGKGEGTAGTPRLVWNSTTAVDNGVDGYPGGHLGKGAPANAGGAGNAHNAGGGGGGNGGMGGQGGLPWVGGGGVIDAGGRPGFPSSTASAAVWRLIMGGGGGGGDANNATTGVRGGVGAGLTLIRAGRMIGAGTILATGDDGDTGAFGGAPDGAGGGGAGGTVLLAARSASPTANISVQANGGKGGNTLNDGRNEHGPGGGGGGGVVLYKVPGGSVSANINGGATGRANGGTGVPHGAVAGTNGQSGSFTDQDDPFAGVNDSNCFPQLTVSKTTSTPAARAGGTATYTITVTNAVGKSEANNVDVTDNLPSGFTYGTTSNISLTNGATRNINSDPTAGATAPIWGSFAIPGGGQVQILFNVNIGSGVTEGTYQNPATATYIDPTRAIAGQTATASYDSATSTGEDVTIKTPANVLLVKRITAINGDRTQNPNDQTPLDRFVDETSAGDNNSNWPTPLSSISGISSFLRGVVNAGKVKPGDTIEYTVYFLNAGSADATEFRICDRLTGAQSLLTNAYGANKEVQLHKGDGAFTNWLSASTSDLTSAADAGDRAQLVPTSSAPASCNLNMATGGAIDTGTLVIDVTGTATANQPSWTSLSGSTGPGTANSYGFVRFTTKVAP